MSLVNESYPIFSTIAPLYFQRDLPVIPLVPYNELVKSAGKKPIPVGWSAFAKSPVPHDMQDYWITHHPMANIGLVTGRQSNVMFIDIDTPNPRAVDAIKKALAIESQWIRVGKKGFVAAYRYNPAIRNFKIKDTDGNMLVEGLCFGNQAVIPPSIHPETKQPYTATCDLLSVIDHLVLLPDDIEKRIREQLVAAGIELHHTGMSNLSDFVARGARDNQMTYVAGLFAHYVTKGERTLQEAFGQMEKWYETNVQKVAGDDIDVQKGMAKIVEFLERDVKYKKRPLPIGWDRDLDPSAANQLAQTFHDEHQEWTAQQLKEYVFKAFMAHGDPDSPERLKAVQYVIERISRSPSLNNLERESLIAYISQTSRIPGMTVPNIRKRLRELTQGDMQGISHTEIAEATVEHLQQFGELKQQNGMFYQWRGAQWEPLEESDILLTISQQFDGFEMTKRHNDHVGILKTMRVIVTEKLKQSDFRGVNFANGFLGEDLTLYQHHPQFGATYTLPYRYMPGSREPQMFLRLLEDCWGQDEDYQQKVLALQEMIAATLFQYCTKLQRCCLLLGVGNSGKSTILKIVTGLFPPDQVSAVPPSDWEDKFAPAMMAGKVLNIAGELPEKKMIDGKSFKEIIDGSPMNGQFKNQQLFKFEPRASHWFASNHPPKTLDTSEGFNRRWLILEFRKAIKTEDKVLDYHNHIIAEEREQIAAWAIEAFPRLVKRKEPLLPPSHERLINDMANENNSVRFFLNESRRIMTRKRLDRKLAAQALNPQSQESSTKKDASDFFKSREEFERFVTKNHTSEDAIFAEYTMFCSQVAGVRGVGLRHFRVRMRELEELHNYIVRVTETPDGHDKCDYPGIVILNSLRV